MFGFERFNGYLGKFPTNNRPVELEMMRKFTKDLNYRSLGLPSHFSDESVEYHHFDFATNLFAGTLREMFIEHNPLAFELYLMPQRPLADLNNRLWVQNSHVKFMGSGRRVLFEDHEIDYLVDVYKTMYNCLNISVDNLSKFAVKYKQLECNGQTWGSKNSLTKRSSYVLAAWLYR